MIRKTISDAVSNISTRHIEEAADFSATKAHKPVWIKWATMAACLCLVVTGGLFAIHNGVLWRTACGHTSHNVTLSQNAVYFSETEKGAYFYDTANDETVKMADFDGVFYNTVSGVYLLDNSTGELYSVADTDIVNVGTLDYSSPDYDEALHSIHLIDVLDNAAYWTSLYQDESSDSIYRSVFVTDLVTGQKNELLTLHDSNSFKGSIIAGKLYYFDNGDNGSIGSLDLASKETAVIYTVPAGETAVNNVLFYEDCILLELHTGLYRLGYEDAEPEKLTDLIPATSAFDRMGDELYYVAEIAADTGALISFNLLTGEITEITKTDNYTYTEIVMCEDGYYFTDPSDTKGGLFYHDFDADTVTKISK